jgi:hypothetical protein
LFYILSALFDTFGSKSRSYTPSVEYDVMTGKYSGQARVSEYTLNLAFDSLGIASIVSIVDGIECTRQLGQTEV